MWTEWKTWLFCLTRPPRGRRTVKGLWHGRRLATSITEIKRLPERPQVATQQKSVTGVNTHVLLYRYIKHRTAYPAHGAAHSFPGMRRCASNAMEFLMVDATRANPGFAPARTPRAPTSRPGAQPKTRFASAAPAPAFGCQKPDRSHFAFHGNDFGRNPSLQERRNSPRTMARASRPCRRNAEGEHAAGNPSAGGVSNAWWAVMGETGRLRTAGSRPFERRARKHAAGNPSAGE